MTCIDQLFFEESFRYRIYILFISNYIHPNTSLRTRIFFDHLFALVELNESSVFAFSFPSAFLVVPLSVMWIFIVMPQFVHRDINDLFNVELIMRAIVVFPAPFLAVISCQRINRASALYIYYNLYHQYARNYTSRLNDKRLIEHLTL